VKNILDRPCMVNVTHTDKGKAKISGVTPVPKGMQVPPRVHDIFYFSLERDEFSQATFESLNDYWKEHIKKSPEYQEIVSGPRPAPQTGGKFDDFADDIPFS
jgi:hypothetical protein